MVPVDSVRVPRDPTYSGVLHAWFVYVYGTVTPYGRPFQNVPLTNQVDIKVLQPHEGKPSWFGLIRVRSPLLTESSFLSFPAVTEMFQFAAFAVRTYGFSSY